MKDRPILMSAPMVRASLDDTKTQTRRALRVQPPVGTEWMNTYHHPKDAERPYWWAGAGGDLLDFSAPCPYGQPGDRLWVRETFQRFTDDGAILYKADPADLEAMNDLKRDECLEARWRPAIHMPRWASRITLEVTGVRVERLQDISEADALAEGITQRGAACHIEGEHGFAAPTAVEVYQQLWTAINGPESWAANPWVWCVSFRRLEAAC